MEENVIETAINDIESTQIIIRASIDEGEYTNVGAVKNLVMHQNNRIEQVFLRGSYNSYLIPSRETTSLELKRVVFDALSLEELGYNIASICSHTFDIQVVYVKLNYGSVITTYHNCLCVRIAAPIRTDDYIIIDEASMLFDHQTTERSNN